MAIKRSQPLSMVLTMKPLCCVQIVVDVGAGSGRQYDS